VASFLGEFAKLRKATIKFVMSAWNTSAATDGVSLNLVFEDFSKISQRKFKFDQYMTGKGKGKSHPATGLNTPKGFRVG
jgi:hypothetical protein